MKRKNRSQTNLKAVLVILSLAHQTLDVPIYVISRTERACVVSHNALPHYCEERPPSRASTALRATLTRRASVSCTHALPPIPHNRAEATHIQVKAFISRKNAENYAANVRKQNSSLHFFTKPIIVTFSLSDADELLRAVLLS